MSLLKNLLNESAAPGATSATAVAVVPARLGQTNDAPKSSKPRKKKKKTVVPGSLFSMHLVKEDAANFDPADVVAKMRGAEKRASAGYDTKTFALEDEAGQLVKVTVVADEAERFEQALAQALHGSDDDDNVGEEATNKEIAEILFDLKDQFTIVNVDWPQVEEDQEEDADAANAETMDDMGGDEGAEGDLGDEGGLGDEEGGDQEADMTADGGEQYDQMSALSQVIDLLKSQQDAQRAEAEARTAEAEAKKAQSEAEASMAKVRQEEQLLDMETYYKKQKESDKEAKRLAQLARWKHDMVADKDLAKGMAFDEQEEDVLEPNPFGRVDTDDDGQLDPKEFIQYLFKYLRDK